ncbi:MAG: hypothetical protein IPL37_14140 [Austwickia sp.]|nr:hypothetical protein [Austwickia sp.]
MNARMRSGAALAVLGLSLTLAAGCAGGPSQDQLAQARQEGIAEASKAAEAEKAKAEQKKLAADVAAAAKSAADAAAAAKAAANAAATKNTGTSGGTTERGSTGGGAKSCGGNISVNGTTSCSFAENVASDWRGNGSGSSSFWSYSPVTGRTYWMQCRAGVPTVCRGGNNAVIYIR